MSGAQWRRDAPQVSPHRWRRGVTAVFCRSGLGCVASQPLAGSVVRFPRPTCPNADDEDKKKEAACSLEVGSCGPCRFVLSENEFVVCVCVHVDAEASFCCLLVCAFCTSVNHCVVLLFLSHRDGEKEHSDECVPSKPGTLPDGAGESGWTCYVRGLYRTRLSIKLYWHLR